MINYNFQSLSLEYESKMNVKEIDEWHFIKSDNFDASYNFTPFPRQGAANK